MNIADSATITNFLQFPYLVLRCFIQEQHIFVPLWAGNTQRRCGDPEHSPPQVLRPAEALVSCIHLPGQLLLLGRAGEQHWQLWQANASFTLAIGQLLINKTICQVRSGYQWSSHIFFAHVCSRDAGWWFLWLFREFWHVDHSYEATWDMCAALSLS